MLLYQGAAAFELWTHRPAPIEVMRVALVHEVYGTGESR
jgi:shikimate 5-dehydrogenase